MGTNVREEGEEYKERFASCCHGNVTFSPRATLVAISAVARDGFVSKLSGALSHVFTVLRFFYTCSPQPTPLPGGNDFCLHSELIQVQHQASLTNLERESKRTWLVRRRGNAKTADQKGKRKANALRRQCEAFPCFCEEPCACACWFTRSQRNMRLERIAHRILQFV